MALDFPISKLEKAFLDKSELKSLCISEGPKLAFDFVDKAKFLWALSGKESSFGVNFIARSEPAFGLGGIYFKKSKELQDLYKIYGPSIGWSFGPWQILYATARSFGYDSRPLALHDPIESLPYVIKKLNADFKSGANSLEKILAAYNAGNAWKYQTMWPSKYISTFKSIYSDIT